MSLSRRKLALVSVTAIAAAVSVYGFNAWGGAAEVEQVSPEATNASEPWIQQNYSEEIAKLSKMEYYVTQRNGTEPPFSNSMYRNKREGIYVDAVSGEPLFSSEDKFRSGTGWPSFTEPIEEDAVVYRDDPGPLGGRTEVASRYARSHLGHVFNDGPEPTGLRYCINAAALEFVPKEEMEERGYGEYMEVLE